MNQKKNKNILKKGIAQAVPFLLRIKYILSKNFFYFFYLLVHIQYVNYAQNPGFTKICNFLTVYYAILNKKSPSLKLRLFNV